MALTQEMVKDMFDDLELAELVSTEARDLYHGKYANHA
mgnify:CR=1 FL=1|tara:strand:+ start:399 stop:512 length:114 start_codon:yes stop_codon:yes gene_type:complete